MVQVENLKRHVASCGFSPVQCSNDGCNVFVNASDKRHHETEECNFRKLKCHDCGQLKNKVKEVKDEMLAQQDQIKNEVKEMKDEMLARQDQIKNEMKGMKEEMKSEIKNEVKEGMKEMIDQVLVHQDQMQDRISSEVTEEVKNEVRDMKVEIKNEMKGMIENEMKGMKEEMKNEMKGMKEEMKNEMKGMKEEMKNEMKGMKEEMKGEMKEIVMHAVRDAMAGIKGLDLEMKNSNQSSQATCSSDVRENIFLVGGEHKEYKKVYKRKYGNVVVKNESTECFNWADQTWTLVDSAVFEGRSHCSSFFYQGQMVVTGDRDLFSTMKCLNVSDPAPTWKDFAVNFPVECSYPKVVIHNDLLFMSVECVTRTNDAGLAVYEVQLVPPYSCKILTRLQQARSKFGMEMFDQKLFILGGEDRCRITASVVQYDLVKNECKEIHPLPYAVEEMATVLWQNNVLVIGGEGARSTPLNTVVMYDVITGHSQILPYMKQKRYGCTAVLTGNAVVVMGGRDERGEYINSVECFDLEHQVWQDLPDMLGPRAYATAVVKPNH
jgi:hypothetical protein